MRLIPIMSGSFLDCIDRHAELKECFDTFSSLIAV
jgi:hypothetical protein